MAMKPNNMVGYVPTASYWSAGKRTDCNNGGTWQDNVYGGEGRGGYASGNDIYVTGNVQHMGTVDEDGNPNLMNLELLPIIGKMVKYLIYQAAPFLTTTGLVAVEILLLKMVRLL